MASRRWMAPCTPAACQSRPCNKQSISHMPLYHFSGHADLVSHHTAAEFLAVNTCQMCSSVEESVARKLLQSKLYLHCPPPQGTLSPPKPLQLPDRVCVQPAHEVTVWLSLPATGQPGADCLPRLIGVKDGAPPRLKHPGNRAFAHPCGDGHFEWWGHWTVAQSHSNYCLYLWSQ